MTYISPNFDERPHKVIDTLVIHHTNMKSLNAAIKKLCDVEAKVSSHYIIAKDGYIQQLVDENLRAWHAGVSYWRGRDALNDCSIGIELDNDGSEPFTLLQMQSLITLCKRILDRYPIEQRNIVSHSDIAYIRKDDPHSLFNWFQLAKNSIGLFPTSKNYSSQRIFKMGEHGDGILNLQNKLKTYGYYSTLNGMYDNYMEKLIVAFKRHFCANTSYNIPNIWNQECDMKLNLLMEMINGKN